MRAPPHFIRANKSAALPQRVIYLDTETTPAELRPGLIEHQLRLGVAVYVQRGGARQPAKEEWLHFSHVAQLWQWVERRMVAGRRVVLVAHNTGFDLQALGGPALLRARGWHFTRPPLVDFRVIIHAEYRGGGLLITDLANYFPSSLEAIGRMLALPKVDLPEFDAPDDAWDRRCTRDVEILRAAFEAWLALVETEELGHFAETLPKQAWNGWRHLYMDVRPLVHGRKDVAALERAGYFGGRTECFYLGVAPAGRHFKVDANSHYAAVMREEEYPTRLRWCVAAFRVEALPQLLAKYLAISHVEIETDVPMYPKRIDGRVVFPVGTFATVLATPELAEAARRGHLRRMGKTAIYDRAPLFRRWVDAIYDVRLRAREAGDEFKAELAKSLLVSLYGRFGMRVAEWDQRGDEPELPDELYKVWDADAQRHRTYRRLAGRLEERGAAEEGQEAIVAIPAHVTSYGRLRQWRWIEQAGTANVLYTDTDSLVVNEHGQRALQVTTHDTALGALRLEGEADYVRIDGPKVYTFGAREWHKGRRVDAVEVAGGRFRQEEWVSMRAALAMGHDGGPLVRTVEKLPATARIAGSLSADGRVSPLRLGGDRARREETDHAADERAGESVEHSAVNVPGRDEVSGQA